MFRSTLTKQFQSPSAGEYREHSKKRPQKCKERRLPRRNFTSLSSLSEKMTRGYDRISSRITRQCFSFAEPKDLHARDIVAFE